MDVRSAAQKFAEISPIHGCSYIANRASLVDGVFWIVALSVGFGLAVNDIVNLITTYQRGDTTVSITMQRDKALSLNGAAVCFDIIRTGIDSTVNATFNEASFNQTLSQLASKMALNSSFDLSQLPPKDADWDLLMKTTYLYVASIVDYDIGLMAILLQGYHTFSPTTKRAITLASQFFNGTSLSVAELMAQTARYICKQLAYDPNYAYSYHTQSTNSTGDICSKSSLTWFGPTLANINAYDDVCFSLTNQDVPTIFAHSSDYISLGPAHVRRAWIPPAQWGPSTIAAASPMVASMNIDVRGGEALLDFQSRDSLVSIGLDTMGAVGVEINSRFLALNKSASPCSAQSQVQCALKCLVANRIAYSGCTPLAAALLFGSNAMQTPFCTQTYSDAQVANVSFSSGSSVPPSMWTACFNQTCAMPSCVTVSYDYKLILQSSLTSGAGIIASLVQTRFVYPMMTEKLLMDFPAFLASFGGSLGLYFGGSLIALAHVPTFMCLQFVNYYIQRRRRVAASNTGTSANRPAVQKPPQQDGIVYL